MTILKLCLKNLGHVTNQETIFLWLVPKRVISKQNFKVPPFSNWWLEPILELRQKRISKNNTNISPETQKVKAWKRRNPVQGGGWSMKAHARQGILARTQNHTDSPALRKSSICRLFIYWTLNRGLMETGGLLGTGVWPTQRKNWLHKSSFDLRTNAPFIKACLKLLNVKDILATIVLILGVQVCVLHISMFVQGHVCVWRSSRCSFSNTLTLFTEEGFSM